MPIKLEMLTSDPEEKALAVRYWAMTEDGEFKEKVIDLVPFRDIAHSGSLAGHVREWCRAFDENLTCRYCSAIMEVKSRSLAKKFPQRSIRPCPACQVLQDQKDREAQAAATAALDVQLDAYVAQLPNHEIDYAQLKDDQALLLLALNAALSPRLTDGAFTVDDCTSLVPADADRFIERLVTADVLREVPRLAAPGTYFLLDGHLVIRTRQVVYTLAPDRQPEASTAILRSQLDREYSDGLALFNLWLDFASADAMSYLADKCSAFDHDLDASQFDEIRSTLREGLKTHSVSQIWYVIWKNVKDAASLARMVYYSEARATATIPGKIRRNLEKIEKQSTDVPKWDRPNYQPAGTLGMLFSDLFGIDEDTPGADVYARLTALIPDPPFAGEAPPENGPVKRLLCDALLHDTGPQMLHRFAALIREGHGVSATIAKLLHEDAISGA